MMRAMHNLAMMLEKSAEKYPERTALISSDTRMTYLDLERAACALGSHLRSLGLGKGDKVAIMLPNCPQFLIAFWGALCLRGSAPWWTS